MKVWLQQMHLECVGQLATCPAGKEALLQSPDAAMVLQRLASTGLTKAARWDAVNVLTTIWWAGNWGACCGRCFLRVLVSCASVCGKRPPKGILPATRIPPATEGAAKRVLPSGGECVSVCVSKQLCITALPGPRPRWPER